MSKTEYLPSNTSLPSYPNKSIVIDNLPVTVPSYFLGHNYMQWPISGSNPSSLNYGLIRLCQMSGTRWSQIETSAGVYSTSALDALDSIITFQRTNGKFVYFGLYGTPVFYAGSTPNPTYADNVTNGPWNGLAECANPTSLAAVTDFVNMIMTRYNTPTGAWAVKVNGGGTNWSVLGKGIQAWETWNEPNNNTTSNNTNSVGVGTKSTSFWWGSNSQLIDLCYTQYVAIKAIDTSCVVTSPGFSGAPKNFWFTATGAVNVTKNYTHCCEAIGFHPYQQTPIGVSWGTWGNNDVLNGYAGIVTSANILAKYNCTLPLWAGEWGWDAAPANTNTTTFLAADPVSRYTWLCRNFMILAAHGIQTVCPWHFQATPNSGNWSTDTNGVIKAYVDMSNKLVGKTIVSATCKFGGDVTLAFSDGSKWNV